MKTEDEGKNGEERGQGEIQITAYCQFYALDGYAETEYDSFKETRRIRESERKTKAENEFIHKTIDAMVSADIMADEVAFHAERQKEEAAKKAEEVRNWRERAKTEILAIEEARRYELAQAEREADRAQNEATKRGETINIRMKG